MNSKLILIGFLIGLSLISGCVEEKSILQLKITDQSGQPIEEINIMVTGDKAEFSNTSNSEGLITQELPNGEYVLAIDQNGFFEDTRDLQISKDTQIEIIAYPVFENKLVQKVDGKDYELTMDENVWKNGYPWLFDTKIRFSPEVKFFKNTGLDDELKLEPPWPAQPALGFDEIIEISESELSIKRSSASSEIYPENVPQGTTLHSTGLSWRNGKYEIQLLEIKDNSAIFEITENQNTDTRTVKAFDLLSVGDPPEGQIYYVESIDADKVRLSPVFEYLNNEKIDGDYTLRLKSNENGLYEIFFESPEEK